MKKMLLVLIGLLILISCTKKDIENNKINLLVTILPQLEFVQSVAGKNIEIHALIPPGGSPATYEPKPEDLKKIENADIYFMIGHLPFEKSFRDRIKSLNPDLKIINTSEMVNLHYFGKEAKHKHARENHNSKDIDPHIWLSPKAVKQQINKIVESLSSIDADNKSIYKKNGQIYKAKLDSLDNFLSKKLSTLKNRKLMVFHPAWGYFARDYDLEQIPIEHKGKEPTSKELQNLIKKAKKENIRVIFVQSQFDKSIAGAIAKNIDGIVVDINPLAADYLANMRKIGNTIHAELRK